MSALVHHYTSELHHLPKIIESGELRPSNAGAEHQPPLLWFSRHQQWEATACKLVPTNMGLYQLTFAEQLAHFGCVRFSLPADDPRLMNWPDACKYAGIGYTERRQMEAKGRKWGGSFINWVAITDTVPLTELPLQRFDGTAWVDVTIREEMDIIARTFKIPTLEEMRIPRWKNENASFIEALQAAAPNANFMFI